MPQLPWPVDTGLVIDRLALCHSPHSYGSCKSVAVGPLMPAIIMQMSAGIFRPEQAACLFYFVSAEILFGRAFVRCGRHCDGGSFVDRFLASSEEPISSPRCFSFCLSSPMTGEQTSLCLPLHRCNFCRNTRPFLSVIVPTAALNRNNCTSVCTAVRFGSNQNDSLFCVGLIGLNVRRVQNGPMPDGNCIGSRRECQCATGPLCADNSVQCQRV